MKGIFIPEITVEMFRNGCLESIEALMAEGEVYDIEYDPKPEEPDVPDRNVGDTISRQAAIDAIDSLYFDTVDDHDRTEERIKRLPSAQPEREDYTEMKREFLRMSSYIDSLLVCSDEQKETLMNFISRIADDIPWTERD